MKATSITWQRTFPDSEPGTDGIAVFEGRVIGRVQHSADVLQSTAQVSEKWQSKLSGLPLGRS